MTTSPSEFDLKVYREDDIEEGIRQYLVYELDWGPAKTYVAVAAILTHIAGARSNRLGD